MACVKYSSFLCHLVERELMTESQLHDSLHKLITSNRLRDMTQVQVQVQVFSGWCRLVTFRLQFDSHCSHLQATLSKLLTYYVLRPTQPPTLHGTGNE